MIPVEHDAALVMEASWRAISPRTLPIVVPLCSWASHMIPMSALGHGKQRL